MSKFPCQNCGHAVIVSKTKMNSTDGDSVVATCRKCGQNVTYNNVISHALSGVKREQEMPHSS